LIVAEGLLKVRLVHPAISLVSLTILADQSSVSGSQQSHKLDSRYLAGESATLAQILVGLNHIDDVISTLEWRITDGIFWIMRTVLCEDHTELQDNFSELFLFAGRISGILHKIK
jgi:hypothetical protein